MRSHVQQWIVIENAQKRTTQRTKMGPGGQARFIAVVYDVVQAWILQILITVLGMDVATNGGTRMMLRGRQYLQPLRTHLYRPL